MILYRPTRLLTACLAGVNVAGAANFYKGIEADLASLLVEAEGGGPAGSNALRGGDGAEAIKSEEMMREQIRAVNAMTDEEYAAHNGLTDGNSDEPCPEESVIGTLPFMMTNVNGIPGENDKLSITDSSTRRTVGLHFLTDVIYCETGVITGTRVEMEQFKAGVESFLGENGLAAVMYGILGFKASPTAVVGGYIQVKNTYQDVLEWLMVPILWHSGWNLSGPTFGYEATRNGEAIRAGKMLAANADVFKAPYRTYMMCHSMGNWVFQNMAMKLDRTNASEEVFEKVFLVAADVRRDLFEDGENPGAAQMEGERPQEEQQQLVRLGDEFDSEGNQLIFSCRYNVSPILTENGIPVEECWMDAGLSVTKMTKKVHVIWNSWDPALALREFPQVGSGMNGLRQALGRFANVAQQNMNLDYFKSRVTFSEDMYEHVGGILSGRLGAHNYMFDLVVIHEYQPRFTYECEWTECGESSCEAPAVFIEDSTCQLFYSQSNCCVLSLSDSPNGDGSAEPTESFA